MIKFYTPNNWRTFFDAPSIIIDDDGYIYTEDEYYKLSRTACGRVDIKTGYIFGKGHYSGLTAPIGMVKKGYNCIEIYGDDFASIMAVPIYYIQGDIVYTAEEYGKVFKQAEGYIKRDNSNSGQEEFDASFSGSASSGGGSMGERGKKEAGFLSELWKVISPIVIIVGLLVLSVFMWSEYFSTSEHTDELIVNVFGLLIGFIIAFFKKDKESSSFAIIFGISTALLGLYVGVDIFRETGFGIKGIFFCILGFLMAALYSLTPSLLLAFIERTIEGIIQSIHNRKNKKGN